MKITLGTAQFGMDYGINNRRGKVPENEVFEILDEAWKNDVDMLDTAYAYGKSEKIIGEYIESTGRPFKVVSKMPDCSLQELESTFNSSLENLNLNQIYGYLIHDFESFLLNQEDLWAFLESLKVENRAKKIGFSLYHTWELEYLLENDFKIDMVQVPFNVFDQRFSKFFPSLKKKDIEIHTRSIFLQGLLFKNPDEVQENFFKIKYKLENLRLLSKNEDIPLSAIYMNFAVLNEFIDRVIIGIDSLNNFIENINALKYSNRALNFNDMLLSLKEDDENIILPINW